MGVMLHHISHCNTRCLTTKNNAFNLLKENDIELKILYSFRLSVKYEDRYKDIFRYARIKSLT